MAYQVPGPCTITFGTGDIWTTTKSGVLISIAQQTYPVQWDTRGPQDAALITGGKMCTIAATIIDIGTPLFATKIVDGLLGYQSDDGAEATSAPALNTPIPIGALASAIAMPLTITERQLGRVTAYTWVAPLAVLLDPSEIRLTASAEIHIQLQWMLLPSWSSTHYVYFSTVPAYVQAAL
jgi:hypothetical protein